MKRLALIAALMMGTACSPPAKEAGAGDAGGEPAAPAVDGGDDGNVDTGSAGLKIGEYACYGSGGTPLIGLGFKVTAPGRYTDLDNASPGRFSVEGSNVTFSGGHLDGQSGRDLKDGRFTIGALAGCEPW